MTGEQMHEQQQGVERRRLVSPLRVLGFDDHQPARALRKALAKVAHQPEFPKPTEADLTIYPLFREYADARCWYEVWWTHPGLVFDTDPITDFRTVETAPVRIERVTLLPAPDVIPFEVRLAAAAPATLEGLSEQHVRLLGGMDGAREYAEQQRRIAVKLDRTTDVYDWDAYAAAVVGQLWFRSRPLTVAQRTAAAMARYWDAQRAASAAADAVRAQFRNLAAGLELHGAAATLEDLGEKVELLDPLLSSSPDVQTVIQALERGYATNEEYDRG
ncbi:hypothetical protein [Streptomyces noursei]